jgi:hypothetical protein
MVLPQALLLAAVHSVCLSVWQHTTLSNARVQHSSRKATATQCASSCVQKQSGDNDRIKLDLEYEFTLKPPLNHEGGPYDDFAEDVIRALLVRMSILKNVEANTVTAHVCDLDTTGQIRIKVRAVGLVTQDNTTEQVRQNFLLSVHRALSASAAEIHT